MRWGTIIIPVLNEGAQIDACLTRLQSWRQQGWKLVVVDGGSHDDTLLRAQTGADEVIQASVGRANQMNAGARAGEGEVWVFLHADTQLPATFAADMAAFMLSDLEWGRFDVSFTNSRWPFRMISTFMNHRSRLTSVATGDQALFFKRDFFRKLGGFPLIPLMEDVAITKASKLHSKPFCARARVVTSSRRWEKHGIISTIFLMWGLRFAFFAGVSPERLHNMYYRR